MNYVIGSNIKFLREHSKLSQTDFGNKYGLTRGKVDSYERNVAKPKIGIIKALADEYKISTDVICSIDLKTQPQVLYNKAIPIPSQEHYNQEIFKIKEELIETQRKAIYSLEQLVIELREKIEILKA